MYKQKSIGRTYSRISIFQDFAQAVIKKAMLNIDPTFNSMPGTVPHTLQVNSFDFYNRPMR